MRNILFVFVCLCIVCTVSADYGVYDHGAWPESWPEELDPYRKQATTMEGPLVLFRLHLIPFTNREDFEAAWPHFLKIKTKGAPIFLVDAPKTDFFKIEPAGVFIHSPPSDSSHPETPIDTVSDIRGKWLWTTYIELAVDGKIVDLNRIKLPPNTPIIDERFTESAK